jgi:hypothetical protein
MAETKSKINEQTAKKERKINIQRSSDYGVMYADGVRIALGGYDVKLTFHFTETLANNDVLITEIATVVLSPQHAKDLAQKLTNNIKVYEDDIMELEFKDKFKQRESRATKELINQLQS